MSFLQGCNEHGFALVEARSPRRTSARKSGADTSSAVGRRSGEEPPLQISLRLGCSETDQTEAGKLLQCLYVSGELAGLGRTDALVGEGMRSLFLRSAVLDEIN